MRRPEVVRGPSEADDRIERGAILRAEGTLDESGKEVASRERVDEIVADHEAFYERRGVPDPDAVSTAHVPVDDPDANSRSPR